MNTEKGKIVKRKERFHFFDGDPLSYIKAMSGATSQMLGESKPKLTINPFEGLGDYAPTLTVPTNIEWLTERLETIEASIRRHNKLNRDIPKDTVMELLELSRILL